MHTGRRRSNRTARTNESLNALAGHLALGDQREIRPRRGQRVHGRVGRHPGDRVQSGTVRDRPQPDWAAAAVLSFACSLFPPIDGTGVRDLSADGQSLQQALAAAATGRLVPVSRLGTPSG